MKSNANIGLLVSNKIDRRHLISSLLSHRCPEKLSFLNDLQGLLFSSAAIESTIEKELRHETLIVSNRPLQSFSSGERKMVFLDYLIKQKQDYLVLDAVFDHLDQDAKASLSHKLEECTHHTQLIQIESRNKNFLPFIHTHLEVIDNSFRLKEISDSEKKSTLSLSELPRLKSTFKLKDKEMIRFDSVCVSYGENPIVKDVSWTINQGDFWQLIGPNGSGKSTLLSLITGDNPKGYGQELYIFGRKRGTGESVRDIKRHIGYYSPVLTEMFWRFQTLEQMILSGFFDSVGLYVVPSSLHKKIAADWLAILELTSLKNTPYTKLSLGLQRITLIIRAFIKQPPLLILDEPLEGLEDEGVTLVCDLINRLIQETETTIIYVSHQIENRISPKAIFELTPGEDGSIGSVF